MVKCKDCLNCVVTPGWKEIHCKEQMWLKGDGSEFFYNISKNTGGIKKFVESGHLFQGKRLYPESCPSFE